MSKIISYNFATCAAWYRILFNKMFHTIHKRQGTENKSKRHPVAGAGECGVHPTQVLLLATALPIYQHTISLFLHFLQFCLWKLLFICAKVMNSWYRIIIVHVWAPSFSKYANAFIVILMTKYSKLNTQPNLEHYSTITFCISILKHMWKHL